MPVVHGHPLPLERGLPAAQGPEDLVAGVQSQAEDVERDGHRLHRVVLGGFDQRVRLQDHGRPRARIPKADHVVDVDRIGGLEVTAPADPEHPGQVHVRLLTRGVAPAHDRHVPGPLAGVRHRPRPHHAPKVVAHRPAAFGPVPGFVPGQRGRRLQVPGVGGSEAAAGRHVLVVVDEVPLHVRRGVALGRPMGGVGRDRPIIVTIPIGGELGRGVLGAEKGREENEGSLKAHVSFDLLGFQRLHPRCSRSVT